MFNFTSLTTSWMIALLAFIVLIFFLFAMLLYLRRCISNVAQKYQASADLSSAVALLEADKKKLEEYLAAQKEELRKVQGERDEQEAVRQNILVQQDRLKELENAIQGLVAMQVEKRELEAIMTERRKELEKLEEAYQSAIKKKDELPEIHAEYDRLKKALERKLDIDAAINTGEERLKENERIIAEQEKSISAQRDILDKLDSDIEPLKNKKDELATDYGNMLEQVHALQEREAETQAKFSTMSTELLSLQNKIRAEENRLKENENVIAEQEKSISAQRDILDQLDSDIEPLKNKKDELNADCDNLSEQIRILKEQEADAQIKSSAMNAQLLYLQKQTQDTEDACKNASERLVKYKNRQSNMEEEIKELAEKCASSKQEFTLLQIELAKAKTEFDSLNAQLPGLRKETHDMGLQVAGKEPEKDNALEDLMRRPASLLPRNLAKNADEREILAAFRSVLKDARLHFHDRTINAFHTSLKCQDINPLTVLAGVSGTGKTLLPVKYAEFMGINQIILSVQPRWDSAQDLFGFYNYLEKRYKATELSRCLLRMDPFSGRFSKIEDIKIRDGLLMVLLDEMNLARPEYYFSEFLSRLELRRTVDADNPNSRNRASIELDTGTGHGAFSIWVPDNILFVGTMNEDESTQTLSDKVLDRANVLRFGKPARRKDEEKPDMKALDNGTPISKNIWNSWKTTNIRRYADACRNWTERLNGALAGLGRPFGFRVEEAMFSYVANYPGSRPDNDAMRSAFADQVEQKILPKLRGCDMNMSASRDSLDKIERVIAELGDNDLEQAFRLALQNANDTGIFLWQGVTRG